MSIRSYAHCDHRGMYIIVTEVLGAYERSETEVALIAECHMAFVLDVVCVIREDSVLVCACDCLPERSD